MLGQLFVHFAPGPGGALQVRTGVVKNKVGAEHWQLEFDGAMYKFCNVFSAQQLTAFAFFDTSKARTAFLDELKAQQALPKVVEPPVQSPLDANADAAIQ